MTVGLAACQSTTGGAPAPSIASTTASSSETASKPFLLVPPARKNHARAGETPINLITVRDRFLAANPGLSEAGVSSGVSQGVFVRSDNTIRFFTRGTAAGAGVMNYTFPIAFIDGNRICTDVSEPNERWRGICFYGYQRSDGQVRTVWEGGRRQQIVENFTSQVSG